MSPALAAMFQLNARIIKLAAETIQSLTTALEKKGSASLASDASSPRTRGILVIDRLPENAARPQDQNDQQHRQRNSLGPAAAFGDVIRNAGFRKGQDERGDQRPGYAAEP